jgi:hypothetical protein
MKCTPALTIRSFFVIATLYVLMALPSHAQSLFERLVMPGDLIQGHAELQKECSNCHTSFSKGAQIKLCLDCHKEVAKDITGKTGFHGKTTEAQASECSHCHTDHKGRDAKIVTLDTEIFTHISTDFMLKGDHLNVSCPECHKTGKKYREASNSCIGCHEKSEPHRGALGKDCASCHNETSWKDVKEFDHSETKFKLDKAHKTVKCSACHEGENYSELPVTCIGCHRIQDPHQSRFGEKCENCHNPEKWTDIRFNHDKDTNFTLLGKHKTTTCDDCHKADFYQYDTPFTCAKCHTNDDVHKSNLGSDCKACHNPNGWFENVAFDHDITSFPLIGLHVIVPCEECHIDNTFQSPKDCQSCHMTDDVHKGSLGSNCASCHNPNGWEFWMFNHNRQTVFPLAGKHDGVKCNACHTPDRTAISKLPTTCISCHKNDDKHRGNFGTKCSNCHNTSSFKDAKLR